MVIQPPLPTSSLYSSKFMVLSCSASSRGMSQTVKDLLPSCPMAPRGYKGRTDKKQIRPAHNLYFIGEVLRQRFTTMIKGPASGPFNLTTATGINPALG